MLLLILGLFLHVFANRAFKWVKSMNGWMQESEGLEALLCYFADLYLVSSQLSYKKFCCKVMKTAESN